MKLERRGATRYNFGAIAEVIDVDQARETVSLTRDLSLSGVFVRTTTPLDSGARVRVRIIHSGEDFKAIGKVSGNVTATGMGIVFTEIEPNDRAILEKWLGGGESGHGA
jgi:PilZ domain